jgi:phosphoheptose isomerase
MAASFINTSNIPAWLQTNKMSIMEINLITEGICKGMKVLIIGNWNVYYDGKMSDEEIIERFLTVPKCSSTPPKIN